MISDKKYGVSLQVLIILFSFIVVAVPAAAISPPVVLEGSLMLDGSPAPVGTEVAAVVDGQTVGETTVTNTGLFGDERSNRLGVSSDYSVVTIYVNGVETTTLDLSSYQSGEMISLDLSATTPASPTTTGTKSSGGGGGFSSVTTETTEEAVDTGSETSQPDETIVQSPIEEEVADEVAGEEESSPVSGVSSMIAIFGLILVGAVIVSYRYKSKK
ncbi:hypothetical protein RE476_02300 [Methanolobus mangrovi]|uniref:Uncharacterized protein n=1 Tax=Methanolobus mangrovi TaxID=3072977 RepID=A0AA51YJJ1_9EURY|nr:hypothetical protein [Methanolobus mangrovi]WMW22670.1 hypothetical protein RE476_02300 [Methanolobus mangrovi]